MKCKKCGNEMNPQDRFCRKCGYSYAEKEKTELFSTPHSQLKENGIICPDCGTFNENRYDFCHECGRRLKEKPNTCDSDQKRSGKRWVKWTVILGIACICGMGAGFLFRMYFSSDNGQSVIALNGTETEKDETTVEDSVSSDSETDENKSVTKTEPEKSSTEIVADDDISLEDTESQEKDSKIEISPVLKQASNYSGPAVAQMILQTEGVNRSQNEIASAVGLTDSGVTDYQDLAAYLSNNIPDYRYNGVYIDASAVLDSDRTRAISQLEQCLQEGHLPVVTVGAIHYPGVNKSSYALLTGKSSDGSFHIVVTSETEVFEKDLDSASLLMEMLEAGFLCYIS